jgi:hypothetical protein
LDILNAITNSTELFTSKLIEIQDANPVLRKNFPIRPASKPGETVAVTRFANARLFSTTKLFTGEITLPYLLCPTPLPHGTILF